MADDTNGEWLTYADAAIRLGIKADSVRRRAAARKWKRQQGNDGLARVLIPLDAIPDVSPANTPVVTPDDPALIARLAIAEARLADALQAISDGRKALDDMRSDRDAWKRQAETLAFRPTLIDRIVSAVRSKK